MFGGIIPRLADRGLPDNAAQFALNAKLYSGELRAWSRLKRLSSLPIQNAKTVFHYRDAAGVDKYLAFDKHTNVVKAPLINETLGRLYYSNADGLFVTTTERIGTGQEPFRLGVPAPRGVFTVRASGGTQQNATTRVYIATVVTTFGEESAPGPPIKVSGNSDGTWVVEGLNNLQIDTAGYPNIHRLRLYRTVTSATGVDYRLVEDWVVGSQPASYTDLASEVFLADKPTMQSNGWGTPPPGLQGIIGVAGGFLAGFKGRTVHMSVPYQMQAWPPDYQFAVEDNIVGLGTFGNTVVVCTEGRGYLLIGPSPDAMSMAKLEGVQPCLSARSIVSTVGGVLYASTDGLVLVDGGSNRGEIISKPWVTKTEWLSKFSPHTQMSSVYQDRYFSFYSDELGFTVGFDDPVTGFTELQVDGVSSIDLDNLTGQTLITVGDTVYEWDGDATATLSYQWRSKPFLVPKPVNFGALQIRGTFVKNSVQVTQPTKAGVSGFHINSVPVGGGIQPRHLYGGSINGPPPWLALGVYDNPDGDYVGVATKVYADGKLVWFGNVASEKPKRLPSGFKAVKWEVELQGDTAIYSVALAETAKGLEGVQ